MKIAFIGLSRYVAKHYLPYLAKCEDVSISGVCDIARPESIRAALRDAWPVTADVPLFASSAAMLAHDVPNAVIVSSPHGLHARHALECLQANVHVYVDKPLACSLEEAQRVVEFAEMRHLVVGVGSQRRYEAPYRYAYEAIRSGRLGDIRLIQCLAANSPWSDHRTGWRGDPVLGGGGALIDIGYLALDVVMWLLGERRLESVYAVGSQPASHRVEQTALLCARFDGDLSISATVTYETSPGSVQEELYVFGDRGSLFVRRFQSIRGATPPRPPEVVEHLHGSSAQMIAPLEEANNSRPLEDFLRAVALSKPMLASGRASLPTLALIDRAYRTIRGASSPE